MFAFDSFCRQICSFLSSIYLDMDFLGDMERVESHQQYMRVVDAAHPFFLIFGIFLIVAILADVLWYHCDFNVYFLDVPLVSSFMSFWPFINLPFEVPVKVFRLFFIGLLIFLLLTCRSSLYISYLDVSSV